MKVVSNTSILIGLSSIGLLHLLRDRFPKGIFIPEAVWREVVVEGGDRPGAQEVSEANWIAVHKISDDRVVRLLRAELDEGEAEAIALALEKNAKLVLLDERDARQAAMRMDLSILGTIGILIWARKTGKIKTLREYLDALRSRGKFRFSHELYKRALIEAGEE